MRFDWLSFFLTEADLRLLAKYYSVKWGIKERYTIGKMSTFLYVL